MPKFPASHSHLRLAGFLAAALPLLAGGAGGQVSVRPSQGKIEISAGGQPFATFYYGPDWHAPFLHALRAASGVTVTRGYPVENVEGETRDHAFHHGLWFTHSDVNGVDFWRDKGPKESGRVAAVGVPRTAGDRITGEFHFIAPGGRILGSMTQQFRFLAPGSLRMVETRVTIRADQGVPLKLGDVEEAGLALRMRDEFREDRGAVLTNSDGLKTAKAIWGKRARWVDYSTEIQGAPVGVTLIDHPSNPRHPTFWHARNYAFCVANAFGERSFTKDPARDGAMTIPAGGSLTFRHRVVVHPGSLEPSDAFRWAEEFAKEK